MITGIVNRKREAILRLQVLGSDGSSITIQAIVDTGFSGHLSLSPSLIGRLGLRWVGRGFAELGDGRIEGFDAYAGRVVWGDTVTVVEIDAADTDPLVGMELLSEHELNIRVRPGERFTIRPLAPQSNG